MQRRSLKGPLGWSLLCLATALLGFALGRGLLRKNTTQLFAGDFPPGVTAPFDAVVKVPLRPTVIGIIPRGDVAPLILAAKDPSLFQSACAIDVRLTIFHREEELERALVRGGENQGVDLAALPVSTLALSTKLLRQAAPRVVALLGRSRGQEVFVSRRARSPSELAGEKVAVEVGSASYYLLLWTLSRVGLGLDDILIVPLGSTFDAAEQLTQGKSDSAVGYIGNLLSNSGSMGEKVLSSTSDAPNLVANVLAARGEYLARYPDGIRRILRCLLLANQSALKDSSDAARALGDAAPEVGDPVEAMGASPPASLKDNEVFFGLAPDAPVTFQELYRSAAMLGTRLFGAPPSLSPQELLALEPLRFVGSSLATSPPPATPSASR